MLLGIAQGVDLSSSVNLLSILSSCPSNPNTNIPLIIASGPITLHRSFIPSFSHHHHPHRVHRFIKPICAPFLFPSKPPPIPIVSFSSTFVEHLSSETTQAEEDEEIWDFSNVAESERFDLGTSDMRRMEVPDLEIKELDELPEQWRRTKLAWLCKQLPSHKPKTLVRLLKAQKKWMRQEDATYVLVHCMRIRENDSAFWVYKWMMQQHWYRFDFALSTKLADFLGKERKFLKCREIFDNIINQGRVPCESTFHILVVAYLSASVKGCLEEACSVYNRMIQLGGYQPHLSLHNSLFRSILNKPGSFAKNYLKQAEFIFHNVLTSGFEIHKDIYSGLIWLHSYQDNIDKERVAALRKEMQQAGFQEGKEVFVSVLRACMEGGDVEEAESMWSKLLCLDGGFPSQAAVYMMEVYAKAGDHRKSLEIFRDMEERLRSNNVAAYHKVIEILCKAQEIELAESVMDEFINSSLKPCMPAYISVMNMYFNLNLHDRVELAFSQCLERCRPSCTVYSIYLDSLVKVGKVDKAGEIFNEMLSNEAVGINARSCNIILSGYLSSEDYKKAEGVYDLMCQKKYDIESLLMEKVEYVLSLSKKEVKKLVSLKLSKEQREMLVGLLLGGLQIVTDEEKKSHMICFEFSESSSTHSCLKRHIYNQYHEWLHPLYKSNDDCESIPDRFATISHSYFGFYADQFWPKGRLMIPNLIHRWLSPRALAYWYMYGGYKTSSGDILLKVKGSRDGVEKIVKSLKARSLDCRVKHKGKVFWIGFLGSKSTLFWKLVEPYVLDNLKDDLKGGDETTSDSTSKYEDIAFNSGSDTD